MPKKNVKNSEHHLPPSRRKPTKYVKVPDGCIEVWQVQVNRRDKPANPYTGIFSNIKQAFDEADNKWKYIRSDSTWVTVVGKAAIRIGDRYHIVYKAPIKFEEPDIKRETTPEPKQKILDGVMTEWSKQRPQTETWVMGSYKIGAIPGLYLTCRQGCCVDSGIGPMAPPLYWRTATPSEIDEGKHDFYKIAASMQDLY